MSEQEQSATPHWDHRLPRWTFMGAAGALGIWAVKLGPANQSAALTAITFAFLCMACWAVIFWSDVRAGGRQ